jgi:hypothetical protein
LPAQVYELVRLQVHVSTSSLVHGEEDSREEENECIKGLVPQKKRKANGGYLHSSSLILLLFHHLSALPYTSTSTKKNK